MISNLTHVLFCPSNENPHVISVELLTFLNSKLIAIGPAAEISARALEAASHMGVDLLSREYSRLSRIVIDDIKEDKE